MLDCPEGVELLKTVLQISYSSLHLESRIDQMIEVISNAFLADRAFFLKPDLIRKDGWLSRVAQERRPLWGTEGSSSSRETVLPEEEYLLLPSFALIPLGDEETFEGMVYVGFSKLRVVSSEEMDLLLLLSKGVEETIRKDRLREMAEKDRRRIKQFSTLLELSKTLLTTVHLEGIIHMTLTATTLGDGLGLNRAMLFLVNEKEKVIEGSMAVGPDSAEEAGRIWDALSRKRGVLSDVIARIRDISPSDSVLNSVVRGIRIPLEHEQCILCRTLLEGKPFNVGLSRNEGEWLPARCERGCRLSSELGCSVGDSSRRDLKAHSFAAVPLRGKGKVIGVVVVDNLYSRHAISDEDLQVLTLFFHQAGLAIENALLYRNLEEAHQVLKEAQTPLVHYEKMAALGEMASAVAHEIKNPLVAIGGFARRLDRTLSAEGPEKRYARTIVKEAARLERTLDEILSYTRKDSSSPENWDLRDIVSEGLSMVPGGGNGGIRTVKEFPEELPKVAGDLQRLKHVFAQLIANACQAMGGRGTLSLRMNSVTRNGDVYVRVEIGDTGNGIPPADLHNIFNPFYTTRESGLGLGLPIAHKIVTSYRGQIEVDNVPGKGATFIVTLPAEKSSVFPVGGGEGKGRGTKGG